MIQYSFPTHIDFGAGATSHLPAVLLKLFVTRPLLVTDAGFASTPAFQAFCAVLEASGWDRLRQLFTGVQPNPGEADVSSAADAFRSGQCDGVIALGGGSSLDVGKALRLLVRRPELSLDQYNPAVDWTGMPPMIALPTTAGTGSEVGRSAVITLQASGRKAVLGHPELMPNHVILDPQLTTGLPPRLTAATGVDALTHCIESFTCPMFHPLCDGIALEGVHLIVEALPRAVHDGNDLDARGRMLVAASMGAVAFQKDLGATHSLAHPLSTLCGLHHGTANALCLPFVMEFNCQKSPGLYRRVGLACGLDVIGASDADADARTIEFLRTFIAGLGLEFGLRHYGVEPSQIEALSDQAFQDPCHTTNPVPVTAEDLRELYRAAL